MRKMEEREGPRQSLEGGLMRQNYNTSALIQEDRKEPQTKDPEEERQRKTGRTSRLIHLEKEGMG